ncbi:hypothetical protein IE81DRAFT_331429 [Ceraceosorus guamensis]|uniref:4Fe-4S ferredoxin-type domain-containing protein n=1 Tax=Ceraceosorus guamensis TaxID=1522189 RepID=A0A316VZ42_9BASI|nr:hypothetical protein IE81DRAFT_331429 [Ceraceosorus guamensis]PWN40755.1 hypothetical protein IE81DRAFT_331429 [Ceraceosorus guamensis]
MLSIFKAFLLFALLMFATQELKPVLCVPSSSSKDMMRLDGLHYFLHKRHPTFCFTCGCPRPPCNRGELHQSVFSSALDERTEDTRIIHPRDVMINEDEAIVEERESQGKALRYGDALSDISLAIHQEDPPPCYKCGCPTPPCSAATNKDITLLDTTLRTVQGISDQIVDLEGDLLKRMAEKKAHLDSPSAGARDDTPLEA